MSLRGRRSLGLDLKAPEAVEVLFDLVATADALIEGYRPGVTERLGIGPDRCMERNPALVYCRVTGWGQEGPLASTAGHDIDYIALSGALGSIGRRQGKPPPPLNLVGDYGGGGMMAAFGIVAGVLSARRTGEGSVVDVAMTDGVSLLMAPIFELASEGWWVDGRESNLLDGGAPFYDTYETADGGFVAVGALEPAFYSELIERLGLEDLPDRNDPANWDELRGIFGREFLKKTRSEWERVFEGSDACVTPIMSISETTRHPHMVARDTFLAGDKGLQPGPAPRFSGVDRRLLGPPIDRTSEILSELGYESRKVDRLQDVGAIAIADDQEDEVS